MKVFQCENFCIEEKKIRVSQVVTTSHYIYNSLMQHQLYSDAHHMYLPKQW